MCSRSPSESELTSAARRLRQHYSRERGGCKVLSVGADCTCPLCDIDRLVGAAPQAPLPAPAPGQAALVREKLRSLVIKWRDMAVGRDHVGDHRQAETFDQCADELAEALDALKEPPTCATCRHYRAKSGECFKTELSHRGFEGFAPPSPDFGCTLHEPKD